MEENLVFKGMITNFDLIVVNAFSTQSSKFPVSIKAPVGELLQGCPMTEADFLAKQGLYFNKYM